jgi:hypothetical protein
MDFTAIYAFLAKALQVPELHAVLAGLAAGIAATYFVQHLLPWDMRVKRAEVIGRASVFVVVMLTALIVYPTPRTLAWALSVAFMAPLFHDWAMSLVYRQWPALKPKSLMYDDEIAQSVIDKNAP